MTPRVDKILAVSFIVALLAAGAFGMHVYHTSLAPLPNGVPDVVCWEMPQADLRRGGWRRVPEVERGQIAYRKSKGAAQMREETSLQCRHYRDGDPYLFVAREWWWRAK